MLHRAERLINTLRGSAPSDKHDVYVCVLDICVREFKNCL